MYLGRPAGALGFFAGRSLFDWLFAALVLSAGAYAFSRYAGSMDVYEKAILIGVLPVTIALGWFWGIAEAADAWRQRRDIVGDQPVQPSD